MKQLRSDKDDIIAIYNKIRPILDNIRNELEGKLLEICRIEDVQNIDKISVRVKELNSFLKKASKLKYGKLKYPKPFGDIQDIIGARIVVYYNRDVEIASKKLEQYFHKIEISQIIPDDPKAFSYEGLHYINMIPPEIYNKYRNESHIPDFFELQILTLYQHAYATTEHDLGYKPGFELDRETIRKLSFIAAQSWAADKILEEILESISKN